MDAISPNDRSHPIPSARAQAGIAGSTRPVRARLNGLPCLLIGSSDSAVTGRMAIPPLVGERSPLPAKGNRATLEILPEESTAETIAPPATPERDGMEPLEITVTAAYRHSGRFTARFLALSDDQWRLLGALGLAASAA